MNLPLEYLAGYFDGEGCISVSYARSGQFRLQMLINSSDLGILQAFSEVLGGRVIPWKKSTCARKRRLYRWQLNGSIAQAAIRKLLPFLVGKRDVANLALKIQFNPRFSGSMSISEDEKLNRLAIKKAISAINQRVTEPDLLFHPNTDSTGFYT